MSTKKVHEGNPVPVVPFNDVDMNRVPPSSFPPPENVFSSIAEESESPAQKKLKIDEEDGDSVVSDTSSEDSMVFSDEVNDTSSPIRPTHSQYDSDEDFFPYYPQKMDKAVWEKYYQQVKESEGFDITDYPGQCAMTTVYPMPFYLNDPKNVDLMTDYAGKVLRLYNNEKVTNYEVNDILTVNGGGCRDFIFYITFSVKTSDDKDDIFQAKVVKDLRYCLQIPLVRPKSNATVAQVWSQQGWDLIFRRALNDWEIEEIAKLLEVLNNFPGTSPRSDKPIWKIHKQGVYTVKSCYWKMNYNISLTERWPWKLIWKVKCPSKVSCFVWLLIRKACLIHEALQKRGMHICSRCFMCEHEAEVNNHLFIHCKTATRLWNTFLCSLRISWVMPKTTLEVLNSWPGVGSRGKKEEWWKLIPACIWWSIWKERNARCFEGQKINFQRIKTNCNSLLFFWCKQDLVGDGVELVDFLGNL